MVAAFDGGLGQAIDDEPAERDGEGHQVECDVLPSLQEHRIWHNGELNKLLKNTTESAVLSPHTKMD